MNLPTENPFVLDISRQQHVFYRDSNGLLNHIFWDTPTGQLYFDQWNVRIQAPRAVGRPAVIQTPGQQHVFYRSQDGHINHIFWHAASNQLT